MVEANCPENIAALEGAQKTPAVWALMKLIPRLAKRSIFGVIADGIVSWQPIQSFMSSTAMNKTLGFPALKLEVAMIREIVRSVLVFRCVMDLKGVKNVFRLAVYAFYICGYGNDMDVALA